MGYGYLKRKHLTLSKIFVICISINKKVIVVFFVEILKERDTLEMAVTEIIEIP